MKMKKLWMALFVCLLMCSLLSVGALAEDMQAEDAQAMPAANSEEGLTGSGTSSDPFLVNQDSLAALAAYFDANEANPPEETIYLKGDGDIQLPEGIHITLPEGFIINLDFNGYRLSKSDMADSAPIENNAILTIEDSSEGQKGGIDGKNRCINNHAVATINGGFYTTNSDIGGGGTAIRNADADSEMTINDL